MADEKKKLHRSKDDRWLAGVCGGLGEYFNIDGTLIRVLFILFGFAVGGGFLIYIILWIIMPEAPDDLADVVAVDDFKMDENEPDVESAGEETPEEEPDAEAKEE
jgi:phage shock protein C